MERMRRRSERWFPQAVGLTVVLALAAIGAGCGEAAGEPTPVPTVDEEYRSFVARYLADPLEGDATVRLRDLPPGAGIPFPEEAILIGSVERSADPGFVVTVLVDLPGVALEDGEATFLEAFEAAGWHFRAIPVMPESYAEDLREEGGSYSALCYGEERFATVMTTAGPDGAARGRITVSPGDPATLCGSPMRLPTLLGSTSEPVLLRFGLPEPFPVLTPPADGLTDGPMVAALELVNASRSHTVTRTRASNVELLEHYGAQLRETLWTEIESGAYRGATWSLWRFQDRFEREWTAVLSVREEAAQMGVDRMLPELRVRIVTVEAIPLGHGVP